MSGQLLEQAAQGDDWVTIPGGVQEICRGGAKEHSLVGKYWWYGWLDWKFLKVFSNLGYSMILWLLINRDQMPNLLCTTVIM